MEPAWCSFALYYLAGLIFSCIFLNSGAGFRDGLEGWGDGMGWCGMRDGCTIMLDRCLTYITAGAASRF